MAHLCSLSAADRIVHLTWKLGPPRLSQGTCYCCWALLVDSSGTIISTFSHCGGNITCLFSYGMAFSKRHLRPPFTLNNSLPLFASCALFGRQNLAEGYHLISRTANCPTMPNPGSLYSLIMPPTKCNTNTCSSDRYREKHLLKWSIGMQWRESGGEDWEVSPEEKSNRRELTVAMPQTRFQCLMSHVLT